MAMDVYQDTLQASGSAVTVAGTGLTIIASISVSGATRMAFHFDVVTQALDDFEVRGRGNSGAVLQNFTPSSWTSLPANGRILESSGDLAAVAAAGNGYFRMDVGELSEVVVRASAAANSASVTPRWSLQ